MTISYKYSNGGKMTPDLFKWLAFCLVSVSFIQRTMGCQGDLSKTRLMPWPSFTCLGLIQVKSIRCLETACIC